ncbi:phosphatidylinositol phospholipase C, delta [Kwoniella mangroviensis CBS 10435]|uniref:Phosphoinositide phospholipase C n=1 Tax=Kwoniella mangroviensis CBS 10435 TaxID=1331196 RepID=A0A1B9IJG2_9TREE|nr:phosphatidylinositol phospholipase C, delta [Kwoniella mangroviensis CBS 8507]OCF55510.1 phosphatidylinositol phospholipase C, delta [Kwoniella mangroviensis CBS 10435]OCF64060.1 phosphatidylinositol phospholipase C, delta [Kwoniella mangroviensis CBS 8507]
MSPPDSPTINYFSMLRLTQQTGLKSKSDSIHSAPASPISAEPESYFPSVPAPAPASRPKRRFTLPISRNRLPSTFEMDSTAVDGIVPMALVQGVPMLKISSKKMKQVIIRVNNGGISWSSKKDNTVSINEVRDLRLGQPPSDTYNSSRWITIVYVRGTQWKVLHMVALTDEIYNLWVQTLKSLVSVTLDRHVADVTPADPDLIWIRQLWPIGSKVIDRQKAEALCTQIGLQIPDPVAKTIDVSGVLDMSTFHQLIKDCQTRPDIAKIHSELSKDGPLNASRVNQFLKDTQKLTHTQAVFEKFKHDGNNHWTLASLTEFLCSADNTANMPQDMTHPIQHYFISSSHNTYLVGEQWRGESTVEGYIRVLLAGCRCVEMDVQTGDLEPVVYHRKTLTSSVSVRDICRAVNQYAFVASPYPVIISAEIHCSFEQQNRLATILKEVFGDRLITAPLTRECTDLPSPEQLKNRIMFKAKPPKPEPKSPKLLPSPDSATSSTESDSGFARLTRRLSIQGKTEKPDAFSPQLAELLVYTTGVKYKGFSKLNEYETKEQFSVSERTAAKIVKENKADWVKHNFNHISRVYPRGTRLTSSNYDPTVAWSAGCQLVALNWQTLDEATLLNHAMFHASNGYVLKPLALRQKVQEIPTRYRIKIQVISGQRMPLSPDLYVEATLKPTSNYSSWSSASSTSSSSLYESPPSSPTFRRTRISNGVTLNPNWSETITFELTIPPSSLSLNFLHLEIKNRQNGLIAQWIRPLGLTPKGYHHLPLYDPMMSRFVFATLFTKIDIDILGSGST